MEIGIMTMHRIRNYGSYLQAYGLKKMIEELGHHVVFVDYKVEVPVGKRGNFKENELVKIVQKIYRKAKLGRNKALRILRKEKSVGFSGFVSAFEKEYIRSLGVSKKHRCRTEVDILIIGSDEVFNCTQGENVGFSKELFGADNHAGKVISYAASFGNTTLLKLERYGIRGTVGELLNNFSALSVRDKNSYDIVKTLTGKGPQLHLDPVLVYDFEEEIEDVVEEKDYILVYAYNNRMTEEEGKEIRKFAAKKKKKLIAVSGEQFFCDEYIYCEPLKMLSYFKHADYVITDTFHGTIFSIINHRPFATLMRKDESAKGYGNQEKLSDLLKTFGLKERCVENLQQFGEILEKPIDYIAIDEIRRKERLRTMDYLKKQIEGK